MPRQFFASKSFIILSSVDPIDSKPLVTPMSYQRRACIRIPTRFKANLVTQQGEILPSKITNISVTGFQLHCPKLIAKNDSLILQICLPKKKENFELAVKVLRSRDLAEDDSGFVCSLGLQIIHPTEDWTLQAGQWIESQLGSPTKRKIASSLLLLTAFAFALKTSVIALGLQTLEIPLIDFTGLAPLEFLAAGPIFNFANIFITGLMIFCGLQVLRPTVRSGFFFTSTAAFLGVTCLAMRLLLKFSLLQNASDQKMIYFIDLFIFWVGLAGAMGARHLENSYRRLKYILERENIYPQKQ